MTLCISVLVCVLVVITRWVNTFAKAEVYSKKEFSGRVSKKHSSRVGKKGGLMTEAQVGYIANSLCESSVMDHGGSFVNIHTLYYDHSCAHPERERKSKEGEELLIAKITDLSIYSSF